MLVVVILGCVPQNIEIFDFLGYVFKLCKLITSHILASFFNSSHIDFHFNYYVKVMLTKMLLIQTTIKFAYPKNNEIVKIWGMF